MKNILIIENNLELLCKYADTLKNAGYEVTQADNSEIGIHLAINKTPNIIVSNTILSNIDGFEILSILSLNPSTSNIPFIFLNPNASPEEVKKGIEIGAADFITNPFQSNQLIRSVEIRINNIKNQSWTILPLNESTQNSLELRKGLEKLHDLISQSKTRHLKKKHTLYHEGDYSQWLYFLIEGSIKTLKLTSDGREFITGLYRPISFIGLDNLLYDVPFNESAEATESSILHFISKSAVVELLNEYVDLNHYFIRIMSKNLHEKEDLLVELAYESVRKRLAQLLIRLSKDSVPIDQIYISRDELAGLAGIATETVSRILSDFKERGLIERNGSHLQILDLEGLALIKS
ncbi:MAG: helix-turn-helix domain-containing protein [Sphingobacterium composti]|uniref:helix-turn-helix domain-containing protein n=1 Tax=Sphingobacterium composti TaxID=363260 RepID=UPI00135C2EB4|nr:helix-turn-helix domain-containing protein [Sphingobacterium composti Ten et al. 2007 non Yoo et al. 2007]